MADAYKVKDLRAGGGSPLRAYCRLTHGAVAGWRVFRNELIVLLFANLPGALGLALRKLAYPCMFRRCGHGTVFGRGLTLRHCHKITLGNALHHTTALGTDVFGNIQRLDNLLEGFEERLHACEEQLENTKVQLKNAQEQVKKPFPREDELREKTARLDELNIMLNIDKRENEIADDEREDEEPSGRSTKEMER